ncbi:MAG: carotenoid biosynthesis protein, partial [Bacteroidota bacterium]
LRVIGGAALMIFLDFFMEHAAHRFDFWHFAGDLAPLRNYVAWFGIALLLHTLYQLARVRANVLFSGHLYAAQLVFFGYFFFYYAD